MISQQTPSVTDRDEPHDSFGHAVALLDVDGNRAADLVVGAPGENSAAGAVTVVRATAAGRLAPRAATSVLRPRHFGIDGNSSDPQSARMGSHLGEVSVRALAVVGLLVVLRRDRDGKVAANRDEHLGADLGSLER